MTISILEHMTAVHVITAFGAGGSGFVIVQCMPNMQELTPEEPKQENPFEGAEVEAAESAAGVKAEPKEDVQAGVAADGDTEMAPAQPSQDAHKDDDLEMMPEGEVVHMPATQDDPGKCSDILQ